MPPERRISVTHVTTVPMSLMFLRGQAAFMRERGIDLSAVSSPGPELDEFGRTEGVPTHGVPMERRITPLKDLVALARLYRHFRETKPDIVHAHTPKGGLLGTIAATLAHVPRRIYHMRGLPLMGATGTKRALLSLTERISCALAHDVLCVSHSLRDEAINLKLARPDRIRVLGGGSGQGVDTDRFDPARFSEEDRARIRRDLGIPTEALVYGFVGRIVRDKGIYELVEAWKQLRDELPHAHLLVVGPFEPEDPIDPAARETLETDPRIHLVGFTKDTPPLYAGTDIVVLPTYREGFPNVPLEAAAMRRPVIATQIPGCRDAVVPNTTGLLVEPRSAARLYDAMKAYGCNIDLRERHALAGEARVHRAFLRKRLWDALARTYVARAPRRFGAHSHARDAASDTLFRVQ